MKAKSSDNQHTRLIETDAFPFEFVSAIAERESWRKEIYRPIYHVHKWWAKRLGSVFRGIILGSLLGDEESLQQSFYSHHKFSDISILDPFMGSGTTIGEAHRLGCSALGRDINPVSCESVRVALGELDYQKLQNGFTQLSNTVGKRILRLYHSYDANGKECDVLYFFWVKQVPCLFCSSTIDLFSTRIVAQNAYPQRKPEVQICCPNCGFFFPSQNQSIVRCPSCGLDFNPHLGPVNKARVTCQSCQRSFRIIDAMRALGRTPRHRLYGKLILTHKGEKQYLPITEYDLGEFETCTRILVQELAKESIRLPVAVLEDGHNTRQAIAYNYHFWRDFFNDRQLLALGWLQQAINEIEDISTRDAFFVLFSGILEFNNIFASYKGEGTGAVRHMFSHHILKPERTPIEANVWGTPKSSGSFSSLFKTRLLRAFEYRNRPFEVAGKGSGKVYIPDERFSGKVKLFWPDKPDLRSNEIYLTCGSSDKTELANKSVDLIVSDPPFFDNVHYSELADFFYAWQSLYPHGFINSGSTTRSDLEVQDKSANEFTRKLCSVLVECHRVLKDNGLLIFTYHHSRIEGWTSLLNAVIDAGFSVINVHPVKSEMSVATPKSQAQEPIQLDIIFVCKKRDGELRTYGATSKAFEDTYEKSYQKLRRLASIGLALSQNDCRITIISQLISELCNSNYSKNSMEKILGQRDTIDQLVSLSFDGINKSIYSSKTVSDSLAEKQQKLAY